MQPEARRPPYSGVYLPPVSRAAQKSEFYCGVSLHSEFECVYTCTGIFYIATQIEVVEEHSSVSLLETRQLTLNDCLNSFAQR